jgi:hypothetical protein
MCFYLTGPGPNGKTWSFCKFVPVSRLIFFMFVNLPDYDLSQSCLSLDIGYVILASSCRARCDEGSGYGVNIGPMCVLFWKVCIIVDVHAPKCLQLFMHRSCAVPCCQ